MLITCRKCGKRYKMPSKPVDQLPQAVRCSGCRTVIPIRETVRKAVSSKGDVRKVTCRDCGKTYRMTIRNLPPEVTETTCKACGGTIPLPVVQTAASRASSESSSSAVDHLFSDASLNNTPDFDMTGLLSTSSNAAITHSDSKGAETLPMMDTVNYDANEEGDVVPQSVEVDFDKITRMVKVLVIGAVIILIVGMTYTRIRLIISRKIDEQEAARQAQEAEVRRLTAASSRTARQNADQSDGETESVDSQTDESPEEVTPADGDG